MQCLQGKDKYDGLDLRPIVSYIGIGNGLIMRPIIMKQLIVDHNFKIVLSSI